jgi:hypothetical protein
MTFSADLLARLIAINRGGAPFLENLSDQSDPAMFGMDPKLEAPKPSQTGKRLHTYIGIIVVCII